MIISERTKCTCYLKCDKCGKVWQGNYYVMKKRDVHYCPSCAFKKGWKEKFDRKPFLIPTELKPYIIKRLDGISLDEHFPKRKSLKIIIKCSKCGYKRQSNSYDVINKNSTLCNSCKQKMKWNNTGKTKTKKVHNLKYNLPIDKIWENNEYRDKQLATRKTKEYRKMMSEAMKKSQAWKDTQYLRIEGLKKYWKKIRGGKELHEVLNEWELYRKTIYKMTEQIFSILEGFKNNIPPYIISHQSNLQMLDEAENIAKDYKCDITKKELFGGFFADSEMNI